MPSWRYVWRRGFAPQLQRGHLEVLKQALETDDPRLIQGATVCPPPLSYLGDWPVEGACVIGFLGWQGEGKKTALEVEEFFARLCSECDRLLDEEGSVRFLLNWYDETSRPQMLRALYREVVRSLEDLRCPLRH